MTSRCPPVWVARNLLSPWIAALMVAFVVATTMLQDVGRVLQRSVAVNRRFDAARAHFVADAAALAWCGDAAVSAKADFAVGGAHARVEQRDDSLRVECRLPSGEVHTFVGSVLPGAAPPALARPFSCRVSRAACSGAEPLDASGPPELDRTALELATRADAVAVFRRDPGLALHWWKAGTDADDFVFAEPAGGGPVDLAAAGELVLVPGHLWVPPCGDPLVLRAERDVVVVVAGNLYLGRSLRVDGPGRVVLATAVPPGSAAFVDADGNGRWSERDQLLDARAERFFGPIEGGGNVYVGTAKHAQPIECAAGLVVAGEVHLFAAASVAGPAVLAHGATALVHGAALAGVGEWRFHAQRDATPGFVTHGPQRPSLLRPAPAATAPAALALRQQTLYLAAPPR